MGVPSSGYCFELNVHLKIHTMLRLICRISSYYNIKTISNLKKLYIMKFDLEKVTKFVVALGTLLTAASSLYKEYNNSQQQKGN